MIPPIERDVPGIALVHQNIEFGKDILLFDITLFKNNNPDCVMPGYIIERTPKASRDAMTAATRVSS